MAQPGTGLRWLWRWPPARKAVIVAVLLVVWELVTRWAASPLLFPTAMTVLAAFGRSVANGDGVGWPRQMVRPLARRTSPHRDR